MFTKDERAARKAAKEYEKAIDECRLDKIDDGWGQSHKRYMLDSFYSGFYAGRDYMVESILKRGKAETLVELLDELKKLRRINDKRKCP